MFYIEKENKIIFADNNKQRLMNTLLFRPDLTAEDIKETDRKIENCMFVNSPEWVEWKSKTVRSLRQHYLEIYVDPVASNPLRWADMTVEEQQQIKDYRRYLLAIPEATEFPKVTLLTFDEWAEQTSNQQEVTDV